MDSGVTNKTGINVRLTGKINANKDLIVNFNNFEVQSKNDTKLKITFNGLEYEVFDIEGHLVMNRAYV